MNRLKSLINSTMTVAGSTWVIIVFALIILGGGLWAMTTLAKPVSAGAITALVTAVLGVVGTHVGHVSGHELATNQESARPPLPSLEVLAQLKKDGNLNEEEFGKVKAKVLDELMRR